MALDWNAVEKQRESVRKRIGTPTQVQDRCSADALGVYGLFRLCHHWQAVEIPIDASRDDPAEWPSVEHAVRLSPAILTHLTRGNLATAAKLANQRLKISGLMPHVGHVVGDLRFARRLAMALAFPISPQNVRSLAKRLVRPEIKNEPEYSQA